MSLIAIITLLVMALLGLSRVSSRGMSQDRLKAEAQANARLSLMIALGNLQKEMGPDRRVSAEAALFDQDPNTPEIQGVAQPHWLSSYDAWGDWLNASYKRSTTSPSIRIADTYTPRRREMFRRWLLSLPEGTEKDDSAPLSPSGWDDSNSKIMVGEGSLGPAEAEASPTKVTRAYLNTLGSNGRHAWWISPENQKALVNKAKNPRTLAVDAWQISQGNTAEVGVGGLDGFTALDQTSGLGDKLVNLEAVGSAKVDPNLARRHFFDLTAQSEGILTSTRTGQLKRDLSLLFELINAATNPNATPTQQRLPAPYAFNPATMSQEPSIRPMSPDLLALGPQVTARHFASWTNMRHFYRMYRESVDASNLGTGTSGDLNWEAGKPYADAQIPILYRDRSKAGVWQGNNSYNRLPVLAKLTFIYSLMTERVSPASTTDLRYRLYLVYTPVYTYWNPYNTELRIPDNILGCLSSTYQVLPMRTQLYLRNVAQGTQPGGLSSGNAHSFLRSGSAGGDIVFQPGEFRVFSHPTIGPQTGGQAAPLDLAPGFNPMGYGGDRMQIGVRNASEEPGIVIQFSHSEWGGNVSYGNTPGSLCHTPFWLMDSNRINAFQWNFPVMYQNDWFNLAQTYTPITPDPEPIGGVASKPQHILRWVFNDNRPLPVAYTQLVLKGLSEFDHESIAPTNPSPHNWAKDWRSRNWIQSPPFYFGNSLYISESATTAHTQRLDNPYVMNFGPMSMGEMPKVVAHVGPKALLGSGTNPFEKVTSVPALELPSAPVGSLAGFAGMRINPGWAEPTAMNSALSVEGSGGNNTSRASLYFALAKTIAYQSGVTGPGIGNSFIHPMLPRTGIYQRFDNSVSADPADRRYPLDNINFNDNKVFSDYWDHVFLLNDALWDDYFVSSLADQRRGSFSSASTLSENIDDLLAGQPIANSRYRYYSGSQSAALAKAELLNADGYLKAAKYLTVDGMFNVNSTSVAAWYSLFAGIRERQLVYRDNNGGLRKIDLPNGKRIAVSRFETEVSDQEMDDPEYGATMPDGSPGWTGVRYLDDGQLMKLAEECVEQVKLRGPFLNFSEFINRRLSNDRLGLMGALQSAIDYDDASPDSKSINYQFKNGPGFMMKASDLGGNSFSTPEAVEGSRFAGIPGYVIQSDLLKPIANTLSVRDDTFRIRSYGEVLDKAGKVAGRAWCEAIVQRLPEYADSANDPSVPSRELLANGTFRDNAALKPINQYFGRKFRIKSFRWLDADEI